MKFTTLRIICLAVLLVLGKNGFANEDAPVGEVICSTVEDGVNAEISSVLGIEKNQLKVDSSFSDQAKPGDALDVIEIIMAIEERFNIEINDREVDRVVGSSSVESLPKKLTIKMLHVITLAACGCA